MESAAGRFAVVPAYRVSGSADRHSDLPGSDVADTTDQPAAIGPVVRRTLRRWVVGGVMFGLGFPVIGWLVAGGCLTPTCIAEGHRAQPVLWIVDLAPLVLGLTAATIGIYHGRLIRSLHSVEMIVDARTHELRAALEDLARTQASLLSAQKLEAIGSLAAGVAHEINTPIQYIGDNTKFVGESIEELLALAAAVGERPDLPPIDLEFMRDELPTAVQDSLDGIEQVARIVRALKAFAHPGSDDFALEDVNELIGVTASVSKSEWKYVAEMDLSGLDPSLPHLPVLSGPLKQVMLNLMVNAAHAIADAGAGQGRISVTSGLEGDAAVIRVTDTGSGIPEEIRDRIFEPFFTTKEVGTGTGQGLAIAYEVVVKRHGGSLEVESEVGSGTTFVIRLPASRDAVEAAA